MYYIKRMRSGVAQLTDEPMEGEEGWIELEELPPGDGTLMVSRNGKVYRQLSMTRISGQETTEITLEDLAELALEQETRLAMLEAGMEE